MASSAGQDGMVIRWRGQEDKEERDRRDRRKRGRKDKSGWRRRNGGW